MLESARTLSSSEVELVFSTLMDPISTQLATSYTIDSDQGLGLAVFSAALQADQRTVHLQTDTHATGAIYTAIASGVSDQSLNAIGEFDRATYRIGQEIIIDNEDSGFSIQSGTWPSEADVSAFGGTLRSNAAGTGAEIARFTPDLPVSGDYEVSAHWTSSQNRAADTPYTISHDGGSSVALVNQQERGGVFNFLDTRTFVSGTSGWVELSDDATGVVIADAVRFVLVSPGAAGSPPTVEDARGLSLAAVEVEFSEPVDQTTAEAAGNYSIDNGVSVLSAERQSDARHVVLATTTHAPGPYLVTVTGVQDVGGASVSAPGNSASYDMGEVIVDNSDAGFEVLSGTWPTGQAATAVHGDLRLSGAGSGTDVVRFTPSLPVSGTYQVSASWVSAGNRASNAQYTVNHSSGSVVVPKNQQTDGGTFVPLGTFSFQSGSSGYVELSDAANGIVIADAVKFELLASSVPVFPRWGALLLALLIAVSLVVRQPRASASPRRT